MKPSILTTFAHNATFFLALVGAAALGARYSDFFTPNRHAVEGGASVPVALTTPVVSAATVPKRKGLDVFPSEAADLPVSALPDLVLALLPPAGFDRLGWDYLSDSPLIVWHTVGVDESGNTARRVGYARVRAAGAVSTRLRHRRDELAWMVALTSNGSAKFGPRAIEIAPGGDGAEQCFGYLDDGCSFPVLAVISSPALKSELICKGGIPSGSTVVYRISAAGRQPGLLVYTDNEGSGGSSSSMRILGDASAKSACAELRTTGEVLGN